MQFLLVVTANQTEFSAEFVLYDANGVQLAYHQTQFEKLSPSQQQGLFDLSDYLHFYVEAGKEAAAITDVGICIAQDVLGQEIFAKLWQPESQRTLCIQLPGATGEKDTLVAALGRIPWEVARPDAIRETLGERNLVIRIVHDLHAPASQPLQLAEGEDLRVLFVFAEAQGSPPLGMRQERRELLRLFEKEIYPYRRVVAHFLSHGVTRERLQGQIQENGGYHIVHWSGHGNHNLLELAKPSGTSDLISGKELLNLFIDAGGFLPRLVFLSACHSGDALKVKDWNDFLAVVQGKEPRIKNIASFALDIGKQPGFTGTAHALLDGGVSSVVAMRYSVGDEYARELAVEFYRMLLAHLQPKNIAAALTLARKSMWDDQKHDTTRFAVCDHATPLLYGLEQLGVTLARGRSSEFNPRDPRLHKVAELDKANNEHFVGRTWELATLGANFIGASRGEEVSPVAVITGLGGMGKTALAAEVLALWEARFEWVLSYQAKPNPLSFDSVLRDIHLKLNGELKRYHQYVKENPADAIYREGGAGFTGAERFDRLTRNLVRALKDEPILLVFDNFETNLKLQEDSANLTASCQDENFERCLAMLARELRGASSRVLITSRYPLTSFAHGAGHSLALGPLLAEEAALYLRSHPALIRMVFGMDSGEKSLALRLLRASRFHPLLMDRLARLAGNAKLRGLLLQALDALESAKEFERLPELFAAEPGDERELAYLHDALELSLDQLIFNLDSDARCLLWVIATANEPVPISLLGKVWAEESIERQALRQMKYAIEHIHELPLDQQGKLKNLPQDIRARIHALLPKPLPRPDIRPLLEKLVSVGLVTEERIGMVDVLPQISCHELVREHINTWMQRHPHDSGGATPNAIRLTYAEHLLDVFEELKSDNLSMALQIGSQALVYCVQAEEWDHMDSFVGQLVTTIHEPEFVEGLIPHLRHAANLAPEGEPRYRCLLFLADALDQAQLHSDSFRFYEQAADHARATAKAGGENAKFAWSYLAIISQNWGVALTNISDLPEAYERFRDAIEAYELSGASDIRKVACELEILRIAVRQGRAEAFPDIEERLIRIKTWWEQHREDGLLEAADVDATLLDRIYTRALDTSVLAHFEQEKWEVALERLNSILELQNIRGLAQEDTAIYKMDRANVLAQLGRFSEAKLDLENCLQTFGGNPAWKAKTLNSLAVIFQRQGDVPQAITQIRRALAILGSIASPLDRATSHANLAECLNLDSSLGNLSEAARHRLAALIYFFVADIQGHLPTILNDYASDFIVAHSSGSGLAVPRVDELLADPDFNALQQWLNQRGMDADKLQTYVDNILEKVREVALEQEQ